MREGVREECEKYCAHECTWLHVHTTCLTLALSLCVCPASQIEEFTLIVEVVCVCNCFLIVKIVGETCLISLLSVIEMFIYI